jgi:hypothetical protein
MVLMRKNSRKRVTDGSSSVPLMFSRRMTASSQRKKNEIPSVSLGRQSKPSWIPCEIKAILAEIQSGNVWATQGFCGNFPSPSSSDQWKKTVFIFFSFCPFFSLLQPTKQSWAVRAGMRHLINRRQYSKTLNDNPWILGEIISLNMLFASFRPHLVWSGLRLLVNSENLKRFLRTSLTVHLARFPFRVVTLADFSWLRFFLDAGIPETHANSYAEVFEDNRIKPSMLPDLSKDILQVRQDRFSA